MKLRRDVPVVLIGAVVIVVAATAVLSNRLFSGLTDSVEEGPWRRCDAFAGQTGRSLARMRAPAGVRVLALTGRVYEANVSSKRAIALKTLESNLSEYVHLAQEGEPVARWEDLARELDEDRGDR